MPSANPRLPDYSRLNEGALSFDPTDVGKSQAHPLRGLASFGPYSAQQLPVLVRTPIRLAMVTIAGHALRLRDYLNSLQTPHSSSGKSGYFPHYPGFRELLKVDLEVPQTRHGPVALIPEDAANAALTSTEPERVFLGLV